MTSGSDSSYVRAPKVNLIALHSFVVVAGQKSMREAAEKLHVTPPTLRDRLSQLQIALGAGELFASTSTGTRLTTAGAEVLRYAERVLSATQRLEEFASAVQSGSSGSVAIACYPVHVERIIGEAARRYREKAPGVRLDFSQMRDDRRRTWGRSLFEELRDGDVDLAVGPPHGGTTFDFEGFKLYDARITALVPDTHPYRAAPTIPVAELEGLDLLMAPDGYFSRERILQAAREARVTLRVSTESANPPALLALGQAGLGIPVLPDDYPLVGQHDLPYPVVTGPHSGAISTEVWIHWRRNEELTPALKTFLDCTREVVEQELAGGRTRQPYYGAG